MYVPASQGNDDLLGPVIDLRGLRHVAADTDLDGGFLAALATVAGHALKDPDREGLLGSVRIWLYLQPYVPTGDDNVEGSFAAIVLIARLRSLGLQRGEAGPGPGPVDLVQDSVDVSLHFSLLDANCGT